MTAHSLRRRLTRHLTSVSLACATNLWGSPDSGVDLHGSRESISNNISKLNSLNIYITNSPINLGSQTPTDSLFTSPKLKRDSRVSLHSLLLSPLSFSSSSSSPTSAHAHRSILDYLAVVTAPSARGGRRRRRRLPAHARWRRRRLPVRARREAMTATTAPRTRGARWRRAAPPAHKARGGEAAAGSGGTPRARGASRRRRQRLPARQRRCRWRRLPAAAMARA